MKCLMLAWEQHEGELRGWLIKRLGNRADAEDMLQNLFLKALKQETAFCDMSNARAWLFQVARNALIDQSRLSKAQIDLPEDLAAEPDNPLAPVERLSDCLPRVLSELSKKDREVIFQCDIQGMAQKDFATQHSLSLPTVKSRIQRARKRLRAQLEVACQVRFDDTGKVCCFVPRATTPEE